MLLFEVLERQIFSVKLQLLIAERDQLPPSDIARGYKGGGPPRATYFPPTSLKVGNIFHFFFKGEMGLAIFFKLTQRGANNSGSSRGSKSSIYVTSTSCQGVNELMKCSRIVGVWP